ncbi:uroporphyrinogen-III C-methyltransferase [Vibrio sp. ZSDZ34]|uniref:uroporphyrinogen-III C-methyltransferase n=1 Tax=Vibrio gelatinilyticus TaxID=2893468 RepID=A0A9X1WB53_9VIBR|nr:uroporphyrinogen-III C-methyltransferase [Vibrio gelatinilyticus]MCJ2377101.1 uroporphyrinogen-III C-methyltransferase [Vibrio gelatinilyticus]
MSLNNRDKRVSHLGKVLLTGAGPGDPELLTLKALKAIQTSDIIVYDNLVSDEIKALFPSQTLTINVGKSKGNHSSTQTEINEILIYHALNGSSICRIKGGDPFIFGRGGEEMIELTNCGIEVEIIPGITSASGCTSYSNIPLTHRGVSQGCTFITAHAEKQLSVNWQALAQLNQTIVVYMGLSKTDEITQHLVDAGLSKETPVALIEKGCCPEQRTIRGTLSKLTSLKQKYDVRSPALIVIGEVVNIHTQLEEHAELDSQFAFLYQQDFGKRPVTPSAVQETI